MSSLFNLASATVGGGHQSRAGGYKMQRSVRLRSSASAYFNRTPASATNRTTWTWSGWAKRSNLGAWGALFSSGVLGGTSSFEYITFRNDDTLQWVTYTTTTQANLITTQVFRDPSAWYHIVVAFDSTQATSSNRVKIYVNGVQVTSFSTSTYPSLNYSSFINNNQIHTIGRDNGGDYLDGYLTEVNFIDGQALTPSSFGETDPYTSVWRAKRYTGTYDTNGFYLNFSDNSAATAAAIGKDYSGLGNNWTPNNITLSPTTSTSYDSMLDVPTQWADGGNGRGNYAVLNPLSNDSTNTLSAGNLNYSIAANQSGYPTSTFQFDSGKWYWECTVTSTHNVVGIALGTTGTTTTLFTTGYGYYGVTGNKYVNGTSSAYGASFTTNDVIGIAVDMSNLTIEFFKNGVSQGTISIAAGLYKISGGNGNSVATATGVFNFGQRPFQYSLPAGFKALNTQNLS